MRGRFEGSWSGDAHGRPRLSRNFADRAEALQTPDEYRRRQSTVEHGRGDVVATPRPSVVLGLLTRLSGYCQIANSNNLGDEFEGLAKLAEAVFGIPMDEEGDSIARDDQEIAELVRLAQEALPSLPEREYRVVSMRFGIGAFVGRRHTLEEVADKEGVTRERVRQIEWKTIANMRAFVRDK